MQLQLRVAEEALEELKCNEGLEKPSSPVSKSTTKVNNCDHSLVSSSHAIISIGNVEIPITGTDMRLLTKMGYKGGGLGVNGQGMTQPLEVMQRPKFIGLGHTEVECSKVLEASKKLFKTLSKENYGNTSP